MKKWRYIGDHQDVSSEGQLKWKGSYKKVNEEGMVKYRKNSKPRIRSMALIVAETFIDNPEHHQRVINIDGDVTNNLVSNIRWVSFKEFGESRGDKARLARSIKTFKEQRDKIESLERKIKNLEKSLMKQQDISGPKAIEEHNFFQHSPLGRFKGRRYARNDGLDKIAKDLESGKIKRKLHLENYEVDGMTQGDSVMDLFYDPVLKDLLRTAMSL